MTTDSLQILNASLKLKEYERKEIALILIASTIGKIGRDRTLDYCRDMANRNCQGQLIEETA